MSPERKQHITAVVLAAGTSSRMGAANKLLLSLDGVPIVVRTVETVQAAPVDELIVVTGHERAAVEKALASHPVRIVHNEDYALGMASSIRCGVEAAAPTSTGFMVCLGDMPLVRVATVQRLCDRFAEAPLPAIVFPVFDGRRGHPVLFDAAFRDELLQLQGDVGARSVIRRHETAVIEEAVDDPGIFRDIDTRAVYEVLTDSGAGAE